jgi:hypothetical protein
VLAYFFLQRDNLTLILNHILLKKNTWNNKVLTDILWSIGDFLNYWLVTFKTRGSQDVGTLGSRSEHK